MSKKREKNKFVVMAVVFAVLIIVAAVGLLTLTNSKNATNSAASLETRFGYLSGQHTNICAFLGDPAGVNNWISSQSDSSYLQGSCCTPMNFTSYKQQTQGLQQFASISVIPQDPYNISVSLAKQLLGYDQNIMLTPAQQATMDQAAGMSKDKSFCCCQCWRYYAFRGQAKYLISHYNYDAAKVAQVLSLEDGCGGYDNYAAWQAAVA